VARKSYELAVHTSQLSKPSLTAYLIDAFRYRPDLGGRILYIFSASIENKSVIQNSISSVEMRLPFVRDGVERLAVFPHIGNFPQLDILKLRNIIQLPATIPVRGALIATCCFEVPSDLLERSEFDMHTLRFRCAEGPFLELHPRMIMDVVDVQHLENKRSAGVPV
jgi:hypothetical protein